jgi:hypothetical protein
MDGLHGLDGGGKQFGFYRYLFFTHPGKQQQVVATNSTKWPERESEPWTWSRASAI